VLAAASLFVASMSHVAAGGHAPGPLALALASAFSLVVCTAVVGRMLTLPRLVLGVAFSQLMLHLLFSLDGGGGGALMSSGHHGVAVARVIAPASGVLPPPDLGMWGSHAVAGLITVVLIRWGHLTVRAMRALARPFAARVRRVIFAPVALRTGVSAPHTAGDAVPPLSRPWTRSLSRRGPPLLSY
jgi:hypothetical protein